MADDLEKFVLRYEVDQKDAIARLDKLDKAVQKTNKEAGKALGNIKQFASGAADELSRVVPGVDKVTFAVRAMSAEFAVAAVGVGALGAAIGAFVQMRERYNVQRLQGQEFGISSTRLEDYQRKFTNASGGTIGRAQTSNEIKKLNDMVFQAYTDPTRMNQQNRQLKLLGVNPGDQGKGATPINTVLEKMSATFQKFSEGQVQGFAKQMGMSPDFALTLRKLGPGVGTPGMSMEDLKRRADAEQGLSKFNDELAKLNEKFTELANTVGENVLPAVTKLVEWTGKLFDTPEEKRAKQRQEAIRKDADARTIEAGKPYAAGGWMGQLRWLKDQGGIQKKSLEDATAAYDAAHPDTSKNPSAAKDETEAKKKFVATLDKTNATGQDVASNMQLAVNMFAGAVASFANAIDEKQAWAAWAGELGKSNGLSGNGGAGTTLAGQSAAGGPVTAPSALKPIFEAASQKYGIPVNTLMNVARVESRFNTNAKSEAGAEGLMQIMPANFKSLGITNGSDATQNVMGGAQLLSQYLKMAKGDMRLALTMYHGGLDRKGWGPRTMAYADKVLGGGPIAGPTRSDIQKRAVQANIAGNLGMPVEQLQQGGWGSGDVAWKTRQLEAGIANNITSLKTQLNQANLPDMQRSKIITEIRDQQRGLDMVRQYGPGIAGEAPEGARSITVGERAIIINIQSGEYTPEVLGAAVQGHLQNHIAELANSNASGRKW